METMLLKELCKKISMQQCHVLQEQWKILEF